jgi:ATP-dependent helicase/nuclease subunit B
MSNKSKTPLDDLTNGQPASIYTMPAGADFLKSLSGELLTRYRSDILALGRLTIFLPTRRAHRELSKAFLSHSDTPMLLPRMKVLGDIDEEDALDLENILPGDDPSFQSIPQAISSLRRRFWLARLAREFYSKINPQDTSPAWHSCLAAADALAGLMDALHAEEITPDKIDSILPDDLPDHGKIALGFITIVTAQWPKELAGLGLIDGAARRSLSLNALSKKWQETPPRDPVIIAGSTGSLPATARLMSVVAHSKNGLIILPGLDTNMTEDDWQGIDDPHPQMGLRHLLQEYFPDINRHDILVWPGSANESAPREALIRLALQPAGRTQNWHQQIEDFAEAGDKDAAIKGLSIIEMPDKDREAEAIALLMRETIVSPGKTASLVTPDRLLARRVSHKLRRWNIQVDDSAGAPLAQTGRGSFLRMTANWLNQPSNPITLMQLMQHPLCQCGLAADDFTASANAMDLSLRGFAPGEGFLALREHLHYGFYWQNFLQNDADDKPTPTKFWQQSKVLFDRLEQAAVPWQTLLNDKAQHPIGDWLSAHIKIATALAQSHDQTGEQVLWQGREGDAIANLLQNISSESHDLPKFTARDYSDFIDALLQATPFRTQSNTHPRLSILGPLEARLIQADRIILGGLNEGIWPSLGAQDPFLSRPMRDKIGLPSPERRIGLSAHDFAQLSAASEVVLTRALRADRAPTKPSRWLLRLNNILTGLGLEKKTNQSAKLSLWLEQFYFSKDKSITPLAPPGPTPLLAMRPRRLSVTQIETLIRDPYAIYAKKILKLYPLDPLEAQIGAAMRGTLLHAVFAEIADQYFDANIKTLREKLDEIITRRFDQGHFPLHLQKSWQARLQQSFDWFVRFHSDRRQLYPKALLEQKGEITLPLSAGDFTLNARADRIDLGKNNNAAIVDYKSGQLDTGGVAKTFNPQLQLTGLILLAGGFSAIDIKTIDALALYKVWNRKEEGKDDLLLPDDKIIELIEEARSRTLELLAHYDDPDTAYLSQPRPQFAAHFGTYDHLARRSEWEAEQDEAEHG